MLKPEASNSEVTNGPTKKGQQMPKWRSSLFFVISLLSVPNCLKGFHADLFRLVFYSLQTPKKSFKTQLQAFSSSVNQSLNS